MASPDVTRSNRINSWLSPIDQRISSVKKENELLEKESELLEKDNKELLEQLSQLRALKLKLLKEAVEKETVRRLDVKAQIAREAADLRAAVQASPVRRFAGDIWSNQQTSSAPERMAGQWRMELERGPRLKKRKQQQQN